MIEFRSDTFTLPTPAMISAITQARLGNDGYGEDPTVIELEKFAAATLGKEAACFMPSGTMANLTSLIVRCSGEKNIVLVGDRSDIYMYESQSAAMFPQIKLVPLPTENNGILAMQSLESAFQDKGRVASIALVCIENPHNLNGGIVLPHRAITTLADFVHSQGVPLHLDGARIFNAAVASGKDAVELTRSADSVQFCLSKGLAAPVGSLAVGTSDFIDSVRKVRKLLGGTMRQAGIIAAAGIVAMKQMIERLREDHANARRLAEGMCLIPGLAVDLNTVQTNTVVFRIVDERFTVETFLATACNYGVNFSEFKFGRVRAVIHHGTTAQHIVEALQILSCIMAKGPIAGALYSAQVHG